MFVCLLFRWWSRLNDVVILSADDWVCTLVLFVVYIRSPAQGATSGWVMLGLDEPSILDNEVIRDSDNEHYETTCPHMLERPTVQQKEKHEQPMVQGSIPKGPPM